MKNFKNFIPVFVITALCGVYFGFKSKEFSSSATEGRGLASPNTELELLFSKKSSNEYRGLISMNSIEGHDYCELIDRIDRYKVNLTADGVTSGDNEIAFSLSGDCDEQKRLIIFDSAICSEDVTHAQFIEGFYGTSGILIKGDDRDKLDRNISMRKLSFYISSLEITYEDQTKETVEPSLSEIKILYSCKDSFQP